MTLGLCETLSKSEYDDSKLDNADRDSAMLGHLFTIAPKTIYHSGQYRTLQAEEKRHGLNKKRRA